MFITVLLINIKDPKKGNVNFSKQIQTFYKPNWSDLEQSTDPLD